MSSLPPESQSLLAPLPVMKKRPREFLTVAEFAKAMAAQGASIVVNDLGVTLAGDRAPTSPAHDVVAEITAAGGHAVANLMDISTMEGGKGLVDQAVKEFGKLDILVNLAGVIRDRMIFNMEEEIGIACWTAISKARFAPAVLRRPTCASDVTAVSSIFPPTLRWAVLVSPVIRRRKQESWG